MIPVSPAAEPRDFDRKVRRPGEAFLQTTPYPSSDAWRKHDYWRKVLGELLSAYHKICSYSGCWTKTNVSGVSTLQDSSVDHFIPKSLTPALAYEWANFRLSRTRLNNRKGNHNDVLDPFTLPNRWFTLNFRSFLIFPNQVLSKSKRKRVLRTIDRLELNTDDDYVQERVDVIRGYCLGKLPKAALDKFWPFIAKEMRVQNFDTVYLPSMKPIFSARTRGI